MTIHELLHSIGATGLTGGYEYDDLGRLTSDGGTHAYSYDVAGNLTSGVDSSV